jgi:hypothetical protein
MANVIELIAKWKDEGAAQGVKNLSQSMTLLVNAIGIGVGAGAISSLTVLGRRLGELARMPFDAASAMGTLALEIKQGTAVTAEASEKYEKLFKTVGQDGVNTLTALAEAEKKSADAWDQFMMSLAVSVAPMKQNVADIINTKVFLDRFFDAIQRGLPGLKELNAQLEREATGRGMLSSHAMPGTPMGPLATSEQLDSARRFQKILDDEAAALKKLRDGFAAAAKAADDFRRAQENAFTSGRLIGPEATPEQLGLVRGAGGFSLEQFADEANAAMDQFAQYQSVGIAAGQAILASIDTTIVNFNNRMQTIGSALRAFFSNIVNAILGELAKVALRMIGLGLLNLATGGVAGTIIGGIAKGLGASARMARPNSAGGGNTYVFQGLNTRTMYMEVALRGGSLARANDLVQMRAEAA